MSFRGVSFNYVLILVVAFLGGCVKPEPIPSPPFVGEPQVFLQHTPVHPQSNTEQVTYQAIAEGTGNIVQIDIWVEQRKLVNCENGQTQPPCSSVVKVEMFSCSFTGSSSKEVCQPPAVGFASDVDYVTYSAVATENTGSTSTPYFVSHAVGLYPHAKKNDPNDDPIPIYVTGENLDQKIDLVFIPDLDYIIEEFSDDWRRHFMLDVTTMLKNAYFSEDRFAEQIRKNPTQWNFYITYREGDADPWCNRIKPDNWQNMRTTVDTGLILHLTSFHDCADINNEYPLTWDTTFSAEPTSYIVAIHETGHAVFGLSDEYCVLAGLGNFQNDNKPNVFENKTLCEIKPQCNTEKKCKALCRGGPSGPHHCDDHNTDLMRSTSSPNNFFGSCCQKRIQWVYEECMVNGQC